MPRSVDDDKLPMISEAEMATKVAIFVERVLSMMTSSEGRLRLRDGFRAMLSAGAIETMTVVAAARSGHEDADIALRELIIEMIHRNEQLPPALAAYNQEALFRGPVSYPPGRNLADTWVRDIGIAFLVNLTAQRWPGLPITRNRASRHPSACSVVAAALLNRLRPTVGERRVEKIHSDLAKLAGKLSASMRV